MFRDTLAHKDIRFVFSHEKFKLNLPFMSDQQRLQQVIVNLMSNAQKFTYSGIVVFYQGSITVSISSLMLRNQSYLKITVDDTGIGMDEEEQVRLRALLSSGVKGVDKVSNGSAGFGLGLLISNEIIV